MTASLPGRLQSGRLQSVLQAGGFAITAEITPPASCDAAALLAKALPLRGLADAVNVTDGASARPHLAATTAAGLLVQAGIEPVLQLTCRDRNRIALQSELIAGAALGVRNLLVLTGDDPKSGDQPETKPVFDLDSRGLLQTAQRLRDKGELPTGRTVGGHAPYFLGVADMPIDPPAGWQPDGLRAKIAAGAQFAQTQFCMDAAILRRYAAALRDAGVAQQLPILVGIAPLASARSARWMCAQLFGTIIPEALIARMDAAADPRAEGRAICAELIAEYATIPGIAGVHLMAPLNEAALPAVIEQAHGVRARRAVA